jgi:hypothetical protein
MVVWHDRASTRSIRHMSKLLRKVIYNAFRPIKFFAEWALMLTIVFWVLVYVAIFAKPPED